MDQTQYEECRATCLKEHKSLTKAELVDLLIEAGEALQSDRSDLEKEGNLPHGLRVRLCNWLCHGEFDQAVSDEKAAKLKRIKAKLQNLARQ